MLKLLEIKATEKDMLYFKMDLFGIVKVQDLVLQSKSLFVCLENTIQLSKIIHPKLLLSVLSLVS